VLNLDITQNRIDSFSRIESKSATSVIDAVRMQKKRGNWVRDNISKYRRPVTPTNDAVDLDLITTRSVISTISNQGKLETINQYKLIKIIGQGSFAKVYLAKDSTNGERRAIKMLDKKLSGWKLLGKTTALDAATKETAIMKKLKHPNVGKSNQWWPFSATHRNNWSARRRNTLFGHGVCGQKLSCS